MEVYLIFNLLAFLTKSNVFTISEFSSILLSIIVDMDIFSNKIKEGKHEGDTLFTIKLASLVVLKMINERRHN